MRKLHILFMISSLVAGYACTEQEKVALHYWGDSPTVTYTSERLSGFLKDAGIHVTQHESDEGAFKSILLVTPASVYHLPRHLSSEIDLIEIEKEEFRIVSRSDTIMVIGGSDRGCLYGVMELIEQLGPDCNFNQIAEREVKPEIAFRAIKFNLPWAPYRPGPANDVHIEACKDLQFWESFLDMMVENRFNALTLWSKHIFPFMIRPENYPDATPFNEMQLRDWKRFWKTLFSMARERGIETYMINWNIVVSPEFAREYGAEIHGDRSALVKRYTRESVTQLINEYEDLTGLGVTLADWMGNWDEDQMTPRERESWIEETFIAGINEADRKVKFIHRAVLAGDPKEMRNLIDRASLNDKVVVEVKFNWSHGHSTTTLALTHSDDEGRIKTGLWHPPPENYFISWMIRNEDFFVLRWGDHQFIRDHIRLNNHPYVDGYFVGSEGYIPAVDYSHTSGHHHKTWEYAFQKQWMFYHLWGRILFEPEISNQQLARQLKYRYPLSSENSLLEAYSLASRVPLALASFYKGTWDYTLYSEGFLAPRTIGYDDGVSPFISLEELIRHEPLDPQMIDIVTYCEREQAGTPFEDELITPPELATRVELQCGRAASLISQLREEGIEPTLESELDDLETWCHLGYYLADKIRAGVALQKFRLSGDEGYRQQSIRLLQSCILHWKEVIRLTEIRYRQMPYVGMGYQDQVWPGYKSFHWMDFLEDVEEDLDFVKEISNPS